MPIPALCVSETSPHQFRTRNDLNQSATNAIEFKRKRQQNQRTLIDILPLITVWLQVRVLSGKAPSLSGLRASPLTPKNSTIKNRGQLLSFLFAVAPNRTISL